QNSPASAHGMDASKDRADGIEVTLNPPLNDFSDLYATPDQETCPAPGTKFSFTGRYVQVMPEHFNGRFYLDRKAAIAIDLCYFVISNRTNLVVDNAWGYRLP